MNEVIEQTSPAEFHTDMPVGEILRRGREHYGQSLEDVERNLRIRAIQLHAIESGNLDLLHGKAYALGFVRSYSEYLGLDGEKMVQLFKAQAVGNKIEPHLNFPIPASESKLPTIAFAGLSTLIGVLFLWFVIGAFIPDRSVLDEIPPVQEKMPEMAKEQQIASSIDTEEMQGPFPADEMVSQDIADEAMNSTVDAEPVTQEQVTTEEEAPAEPQQQGIILNIQENSWVEIRDSNNRAIVSRVLKEGDQYFVPDRPDLRMSLGNAAGIEIVIDGKALPALGERGQVIRNISLDIKSLKELAGEGE